MFDLAETIVDGGELDRKVEMWYGVYEEAEERTSGHDDWADDIKDEWWSCYEKI